VWSVAHSKLRRNLCASASDDGTAALWSGMGLSGRAAPPLNPARGCPVTCVDFSAEDENALLVACANGAAYVYDLRNRWAAAVAALVAMLRFQYAMPLSCCDPVSS
jgi:WD40 repeat protein